MQQNNGNKPMTCPQQSDNIPIKGTTKAPPETPIIIKAEISLAFS